MISLRVRHRLFDIVRVGKLTGPGARVTPESQRRDSQRDEAEHEAEELENAIAAGLATITARDGQSWFRLCDDALRERLL